MQNMFILRSVSKCLKKFNQPNIVLNRKLNASKETQNEDMFCSQSKNRIVWVDMEMTGLEVETDRILEVACVITDENLVTVSDEFQSVIHQSDKQLKKMNDWSLKTHAKTGLTEESRNSLVNESAADESLLKFISKYVPEGKCPMAGNSVYMDRLFLRKYMPLSNDYMHYRIIDVSSIKEVVKRWKPEIFSAAPNKSFIHRALPDIKESIEELNFYRKNVFNPGASDDTSIKKQI